MTGETIHIVVQIQKSFFSHIIFKRLVVGNNHIKNYIPFIFWKYRNEKNGSYLVAEYKSGLMNITMFQGSLE